MRSTCTRRTAASLRLARAAATRRASTSRRAAASRSAGAAGAAEPARGSGSASGPDAAASAASCAASDACAASSELSCALYAARTAGRARRRRAAADAGAERNGRDGARGCECLELAVARGDECRNGAGTVEGRAAAAARALAWRQRRRHGSRRGTCGAGGGHGAGESCGRHRGRDGGLIVRTVTGASVCTRFVPPRRREAQPGWTRERKKKHKNLFMTKRARAHRNIF
jgi:hypothetical protein